MQIIDERILLDIVGRIYDCVIDHRQWRPTVEKIRQTFRWHNAQLTAISPADDRQNIIVLLGYPDEYLPIVEDPSYLSDILELWGGMPRINAAPLAEPLLQSQMGDASTTAENRYYRDFAAPQGIVDALSIALAREPNMIAALAGGIHGSVGAPTEAELEGLRVIAPHLRRAVTIANLFEDMRTESAMFAAALETSRAGILLVDEKLRIIHANSMAGAMLSNGDPLREHHGRLTLREELSHGALASAVAAKAIHLGRSGSGIPTRRRDGSAALVHVLPLNDGRVRPGIASRAAAAVFVAPSPGPINLPNEALSLLFNLTPAEVRVMELISEGHDITDAADQLGVAQSTVKTHLLRVYQKTGTRGQKDLSALARGIAVPW